MEEFTCVNFLKRMGNGSLAFIGNSLSKQQFQSLVCMITGGEDRHDVLDVGCEYGLVKVRGSKLPDGWAYRFSSTRKTYEDTILSYVWFACTRTLFTGRSSLEHTKFELMV